MEEKSIGWPKGRLEDFWVNSRREEDSSSEFHVLVRSSPPAGS